MILVTYCKCLIAAMLQPLYMLGTVNRPFYPRAIIEQVQQTKFNIGWSQYSIIIIVSITGLKYKLEQIKFVATFKYYHSVVIIIKLLYY